MMQVSPLLVKLLMFAQPMMTLRESVMTLRRKQ